MVSFKLNANYQYKLFAILICLCLPLGIGSVHLFDWDEVNFAEIAREMIVTKDYFHVQINFQPFWEKPPLFFWLQVLMMKIFGINEYASRMPNVLVGIFTMYLLFKIGTKHFSPKFGLIWILAYFGSILPHFYFKSGIIDPLFNLLIFAGLHYFVLYQEKYNLKYLVFTSIMIGLAILTKGPVAGLIASICVIVFWIIKRKKIVSSFYHILIGIFIVMGITSIWFISEIIEGGGWDLFKKFIEYQIRLFSTSEAGHGQPFYYHFFVLFFGCFPISLIAFPYLLKNKSNEIKDSLNSRLYSMMHILFWVVLILFSITTTKIIHYSSLCYFPLSFIATYYLYKKINDFESLSKIQFILILIVGILFAIIFIGVPFLFRYASIITPYIKDPFAVSGILLPIKHSNFEFYVGAFFLIVFIFLLIKIKHNITYIIGLFFLNIITITLLLIVFVPPIEKHIQGSMISFFKQHADSSKYVMTYGFKSYAQYFYTNKLPLKEKKAYDENWLLGNEIDKPVFIVSKIFDKEKVSAISNTEFLYEAGGFCFFKRQPK